MAGVGTVQDVVMHQRREVDELDDAGSADEGVGGRAPCAGAECQQGTEAFTRVGEYVTDHRAYFRFEREFLRCEEFLERREVSFKAGVQRGGHAAMCR